MIEEIGKLTYHHKHDLLHMWQVTVNPGTMEIRNHRHINFEIGMILSGSGNYLTRLGNKKITAGQIYVFPSNEPHCITEIDSVGLKILNLHFSSRMTDRIPGFAEKYPYLFFNSSRAFQTVIPPEKNGEIREMILKIRKELTDRKEGYDSAVSALLEMIFVELIRCHGYYSANESLTPGVIAKIENGIEYINEHYTENITLETIAAQCSITPNYFSKLFGDALNMKLWDYITAKRIEKAKRMLSKNQNSLSILDIATECGYNNSANFNRAFKTYTGFTPSEYEKSRKKGTFEW